MSPWVPASNFSPPVSFPPISRARSARPSSIILLTTAWATWQATGFAPKVDPCMPGLRTSAIWGFIITAPMGRPPASGLARVITSGSIP